MGWIIKRARCLVLVSIASAIGTASADAATIVVDFENETAFDPVPGFGAPDPDVYTNALAPGIHFRDTLGEDLFIANGVSAINPSNALAVLFDDASELLIELDFTATAISMNILNFDPLLMAVGDEAVLTVFLGAVQVGQETEALNDPQTLLDPIMFSGVNFDSATLVYSLQSGAGLTEIVDNVSVTESVIPEPSAAIVFGVGALLVGAASGRRRGSKAGIHR